jgi:hypothetical protein
MIAIMVFYGSSFRWIITLVRDGRVMVSVDGKTCNGTSQVTVWGRKNIQMSMIQLNLKLDFTGQ